MTELSRFGAWTIWGMPLWLVQLHPSSDLLFCRYMDTLYGQSEILDIDMMHFEKAVTAGNDRSCRIWKMLTDSQLVFRRLQPLMPQFSLLFQGNQNCQWTATGYWMEGALFRLLDGIQLWNIAKKKAIATIKAPHPSLKQEHTWVQSLATTHGADLIVNTPRLQISNPLFRQVVQQTDASNYGLDGKTHITDSSI